MKSFQIILLLATLGIAFAGHVAVAQTSNDTRPPILDIDGQPLEKDVEYYVIPGITDVAGDLTLVLRNNSCPYYAGQVPRAEVMTSGTPIKFTPFDENESIIRESRDIKVEFSAVTICIQSLAWRVGEEYKDSGRRLIPTGHGEVDYFRIDNNNGAYNFVWCPGESCPDCGRPRCGSVGILIDDEDNRLLALDGTAFPFLFMRV